MNNNLLPHQQNIEVLGEQPDTWFRSTAFTEVPPISDVFEPNYLLSSLTMKDVHLGELIFGASRWTCYGLPPTKSNPLTEMFAHEGK